MITYWQFTQTLAPYSRKKIDLLTSTDPGTQPVSAPTETDGGYQKNHLVGADETPRAAPRGTGIVAHVVILALFITVSGLAATVGFLSLRPEVTSDTIGKRPVRQSESHVQTPSPTKKETEKASRATSSMSPKVSRPRDTPKKEVGTPREPAAPTKTPTSTPTPKQSTTPSFKPTPSQPLAPATQPPAPAPTAPVEPSAPTMEPTTPEASSPVTSDPSVSVPDGDDIVP